MFTCRRKKLINFKGESKYYGIKFKTWKTKLMNKEGKYKIYYLLTPCRNTNIRFWIIIIIINFYYSY